MIRGLFYFQNLQTGKNLIKLLPKGKICQKYLEKFGRAFGPPF